MALEFDPEKPYLVISGGHGLVAQWFAPDGNQLNLYAEQSEDYPALGPFRCIWSTEREHGGEKFTDREEALEFCAEKATALGLPPGYNWVPPTDEEKAEEQRRFEAYKLRVINTSQKRQMANPDVAMTATFPEDDEFLGPWYLTSTPPSRNHGDCLLCKNPVTGQKCFFELIADKKAAIHVVCAAAVKDEFPQIDFIWAPNGF